MKVVIVDDEPQNLDSLVLSLQAVCPDLEIAAQCATCSDAKAAIQSHNPQLVFLDVELPDGSGFDLLRSIEKINFKVIFITAFAHYALEAIKFSAIDYLLKPLDEDELLEAVNKAKLELQHNHHNHINGFLSNLEHPEKASRLAVPIKDGVAFLEPLQIIRLEADGSYTHIFTKDGKYTAIKNLKEYEDMLLHFHFFRSHHSHLINLKHVKTFNRRDGFFATMSDGTSVEISRRKKDDFLKVMQHN